MSSLRIALGCVAVHREQQFLQSAAMAKVVNTATNLGALLVFGFGG